MMLKRVAENTVNDPLARLVNCDDALPRNKSVREANGTDTVFSYTAH